MSSVGYHEPIEELSHETRDMHRAIVSLMEELEAIDWYNQRVDACKDKELKAILAHNRDEEKEHASMVLEWIRRLAVLTKAFNLKREDFAILGAAAALPDLANLAAPVDPGVLMRSWVKRHGGTSSYGLSERGQSSARDAKSNARRNRLTATRASA